MRMLSVLALIAAALSTQALGLDFAFRRPDIIFTKYFSDGQQLIIDAQLTDGEYTETVSAQHYSGEVTNVGTEEYRCQRTDSSGKNQKKVTGSKARKTLEILQREYTKQQANAEFLATTSTAQKSEEQKK